MILKRTILTIFILLLIIFSNGSIAINSSFNYKEIKTLSDFNELWAVLITYGSPSNDDKNAEDLLNILKNNGWDENNILYLRQKEATKNAILNISDRLNDLGVEEEDMVLFFFSMHGNRIEDVPPLDEPDNMDEAIAAYDEDNKYVNVLDDELRLMFEEIKSENMVLIFETCFSGGMIDGFSDLKKSGRIIITSAKENETSFGLFILKGWLFPHFINKGLKGKADKNNDGLVTAEETYTYARDPVIRRTTIFAYLLYIVHRRLIIQHPQIYDGWPTEENNNEELILINLN
jgi:hypothetical protein